MHGDEDTTVGLIDSIAVIARVLAKRDLSGLMTKDALMDLCENEHVQALLTSVKDEPADFGDDRRRAKIEQIIFDECPTWEEQFAAGPGQVVSVSDAAVVLSKYIRGSAKELKKW